jgi:hypothetical protein
MRHALTEDCHVKISEMEQCHESYLAAEAEIRERVERREFPAVFDPCRKSFDQIGPAVQFRRRREISPEFPPLTPLDVVLTYAPPLFERTVLESLVDWLRASRRILAAHPTNYWDLANAALAQEDAVRTAWNEIARQPGVVLADLLARLPVIRSGIERTLPIWETLGIVVCQRHGLDTRLCLRTRLDEEIEAVCPACGVRGRGKKEILWRNTTCKKCGASGHYHLVCPAL